MKTLICKSVAEEFSRMTSTRYTLEELSVEASLLPAHVDPSRLEDYLRDDEFIKVCFKNILERISTKGSLRP